MDSTLLPKIKAYSPKNYSKTQNKVRKFMVN